MADSQQPGLVTAVKRTYAQRGIKGFYSGCTAVVIGNAAKAGVRFTTYDQFKSLLKDKDVSRAWFEKTGNGADGQGKLSAPRSMLAGLGAGMMEAIIAVTPSETIKCAISRYIWARGV